MNEHKINEQINYYAQVHSYYNIWRKRLIRTLCKEEYNCLYVAEDVRLIKEVHTVNNSWPAKLLKTLLRAK